MPSKKKTFTLRLNDTIGELIEKKANEIGVSKNSVILMILNKELHKVG